ncbi:hypothetical protein RF11_03966 [Thelohanellus kitauei]|uniref:Uncharacterized protein n=1 Tax=Thelohanellus kitauei TaxID=669202 RepID=A0A0C2MNP9_THEKT|nr:hypothetical protein RF11_03966 [Thelohanellus kitauei]
MLKNPYIITIVTFLNPKPGVLRYTIYFQIHEYKDLPKTKNPMPSVTTLKQNYSFVPHELRCYQLPQRLFLSLNNERRFKHIEKESSIQEKGILQLVDHNSNRRVM